MHAANDHAAIAPTADRLAQVSTAARQRIEAVLHLSHRPPVSEPVRQCAALLLAGWWAVAEIHDATPGDLYPLTAAAIDAADAVARRASTDAATRTTP